MLPLADKVYNSFKQGLTNFANTNGPALPEAVWGAWVRQGQEGATYPYFPDKDERGSQRGSGNSYFLEDASFIRLSSALPHTVQAQYCPEGVHERRQCVCIRHQPAYLDGLYGVLIRSSAPAMPCNKVMIMVSIPKEGKWGCRR